MHTRIPSGIVLVPLLVLALVACSTAPPQEQAPENFLPPAVDYSHPRAKLIIGSNDLLGVVRLHSPAFRNVGQLTQAQVQLENYSGETLDLEYKFDWSDTEGFKAGNSGAWQFVSLSGNSSEVLSSVGKVPEATQITVTVRLPGDMFESPPETMPTEEYQYQN